MLSTPETNAQSQSFALSKISTLSLAVAPSRAASRVPKAILRKGTG